MGCQRFLRFRDGRRERQSDREGCSLSGCGAHRRGAAVCVGERGNDREAETRPAARARVRGFGAVEALEHVRQALGVDPRA